MNDRERMRAELAHYNPELTQEQIESALNDLQATESVMHPKLMTSPVAQEETATSYVLMVSDGTDDYHNSNEGPFDTLGDAVTFANAEGKGIEMSTFEIDAPTVTYMMRVWVGPTMVDTMAAKFREAGINVETLGTEHVYFTIETTDGSYFTPELNARLKFQHKLLVKHGTKFGLEVRDITILRRIA